MGVCLLLSLLADAIDHAKKTILSKVYLALTILVFIIFYLEETKPKFYETMLDSIIPSLIMLIWIIVLIKVGVKRKHE
jgi:hypothetical protein